MTFENIKMHVLPFYIETEKKISIMCVWLYVYESVGISLLKS